MSNCCNSDNGNEYVVLVLLVIILPAFHPALFFGGIAVSIALWASWSIMNSIWTGLMSITKTDLLYAAGIVSFVCAATIFVAN